MCRLAPAPCGHPRPPRALGAAPTPALRLTQYLRGKIKVDKKTGNLGDNVKLASSKTHITVTSGEARARRGNPRLLPHPPLGS